MATQPSPIGKRVGKARRASGLNQAELAARAGVPPSYISRLERGEIQEPSPARLQELADGLGISPNVLLYGAPTVDPSERDALRQLIERRIGPDDAPLLSEMVDVLADWSPDERSFAVEMVHRMIVSRSSTPRPHTGNRTPTS